MNSIDLTTIINIPYALRNRSNNHAHHNRKESIPQNELTPEIQPKLAVIVKNIAEQIVGNPASILRTTYTEDERKKDWQSLIKKKVLTNTNELEPLDARSKPGHKLLDHHMPHFYDVKNYKGISVKSLITQTAMEKALYQNLQMHSTPYASELRRMLTMTGGLGNVTKYGAPTTKAIVQYFRATRVLDPCTGWGGRMLGTLAAGTTTTYTGCEPDPNTAKGLMDILNDPAIPTETSDRAEIYENPVEEALPTLQTLPKFDLLLTSPPYFNLELYTAGTQSTNTWKTWEEWVAKWLKPTILGCLDCLTIQGTSCWSVKNFKTDKAYPLADVVKQIHKEAGWTLVKTIKMTGSARPGTNRITSTTESFVATDGTTQQRTVKKEARQSEEETFCFQRATSM